MAEVRLTLQTRFGAVGIDHLINNAGTGTFAMYADTTAEQFDDLIRVNLRARTSSPRPSCLCSGRAGGFST